MKALICFLFAVSLALFPALHLAGVIAWGWPMVALASIGSLAAVCIVMLAWVGGSWMIALMHDGIGYPFALAVSLLLIAPEIAHAADGTAVLIPWGDWAVDLLSLVATIVIALIGKRIHVWLDARIGKEQTDRVEQLLEKAIAYGVNATRGAAAGKTLSVSIGNAVLAEAASYAITCAPKLVAWAGGPDAIEKKILARLNLDAAAGN